MAEKSYVVYGSISKEETIKSVEYNTTQNTFVAEIMEPFPGYHHALPDGTKPGSIFIVLAKPYTDVEIFRAINNIEKYFKSSFDAKPASISIIADEYKCVRVRNLNSFELISEFQQCLIDEGFKLYKAKHIETKSIIKINKCFNLTELDQEIFRDQDDSFTFYIKIPVELKWKVFETITYKVKNNVDNSNYDVALGYFYLDGITDFIRVYAHEPTKERLLKIRSMYLDEISKYFQS